MIRLDVGDRAMLPTVIGWRCRFCSTSRDVAEPGPAVCIRSANGGRHVLDLVVHGTPPAAVEHSNPFIAYRERLAFDAFAAAHGMRPAAREALIAETDALIAAVAGTGFRETPLARNAGLSDALGFSAIGGVWVKDETRNVAGSHKARHLMTSLLALRASELMRLGHQSGKGVDRSRSLAISSCGNAAIAASTLAAAVSWPIRVFVPPTASAGVLARLESLGATVVTCPRRTEDPPGDPCLLRFNEATAAGAIPFGVIGSANAWCLDGGRTIGWELADQMTAAGVDPAAVFVQVGGGALGTCLAAGLVDGGWNAPLYAVQTEGCAPLARAARLAGDRGVPPAHYAAQAAELMWPWETTPSSLADGILDDETYDWVGLLTAAVATSGQVVVAAEPNVIEAARLGSDVSGIDASPTGVSGLAGLIEARADFRPDDRVVVLFTGVRR